MSKPNGTLNEKEDTSTTSPDGSIIYVNASGYKDQLRRQYGVWSTIGLALTIDNAWVTFGGALTLSIANGGPAGVLYEFLVACVYYGFIATSLAELASSVPSSAGVYAWASLTAGPRYGRIVGFYAGWLTYWAWLFGLAAFTTVPANIVVQIYSLFHTDYVFKPWHSYIASLIIIWASCAIIVLGNRLLPFIGQVGMFLVVAGGLVTVIVAAALPKMHASSYSVWADFENVTGWNNGMAFLLGVLQGCYAIGTPEGIAHLAEEVSRPRTQIPIAMFGQIGIGAITAFIYGIAIFYGISDLDSVIGASGAFPLAAIYLQVTNNNAAATTGLLLIVFLSATIGVISDHLCVSRIWWTLARDKAIPFSGFFARVDEDKSCPIMATIFSALMASAFAAIEIGSQTAFADLTGAAVTMTTTAFALMIGGHVLTGRKSVPQGPFWMSGAWGYVINITTLLLIVFFNIIFCFPTSLPVQASTMNYNSVILCGITAIATAWWLVSARKNYPGPLVMRTSIDIQER